MIKAIDGFEGYFADSEGFILSSRRSGSNRMDFPLKKLKAYWSGGKKTKHLKVSLYKNKNKTKRYVHQLVLETFVPKPFSNAIVRHKNDIQSNNKLDNLEWGSARDNSIDLTENYRTYKAFYIEHAL